MALSQMDHRRYVLMNPGPVVIEERVRQALLAPDACHREPEFSQIMSSVRQKAVRVCGGDDSYTAVVLTGSGTAALEATISSAIPPRGKLLVLDNGHYAERMAEIAQIHSISVQRLEHGWAVPLDLGRIEAVLASDDEITHVGLIHHETSTGMLNPLHEVGAIVARHGRSLIVDAISSLGAEPLDVKVEGIDWCIGTANKCLEGVPGLSFVCAPRAQFEGLARLPRRTFYLDLHSQFVAQEKQQSPSFTPAVQTFMAFDVALDLALAEGVQHRTARYRQLATRLRAGLEALNLQLLLPSDQRSGCLTTVMLPEDLSYEQLHDRLKAQGFVIYAGQETLRNRAFRLATMGQMTLAEIDSFLAALAAVLERPVPDIEASLH